MKGLPKQSNGGLASADTDENLQAILARATKFVQRQTSSVMSLRLTLDV